MKFLLSPLEGLLAWLDRMFCVAVAMIFALAPGFTQQYLDHLKNTKDLAAAKFAVTRQQAAAQNLSPEGFIQQEIAHHPDRKDSLGLVSQIIERHQAYQAHYQKLEAQPSWWKPIFLVWKAEPNLTTSLDYKPILSEDRITGFYALLGGTLAWLLTLLIRWPWVRKRKPSGNL
ncbi:MAG: DUF2937 family protein [Bacteroidota bacterium]